MTENKDQDKLFADLDALTEQQIEVGLAAGVWNEQVRPLVQHYLYDLKLKRVEAAADRLNEMEKAVQLAVSEAIKAKTRANEALIMRWWQQWQERSSPFLLCGDMVSSHLGDGLASLGIVTLLRRLPSSPLARQLGASESNLR